MQTEDPDATFAAAVRKQRELHGWSQAELAERIAQFGVTFHATTVYKIEQGKRKVTVAEAIALAHALRVSPSELLTTGHDSAFVAKEVLLDHGMEVLLHHERVTDLLTIMVKRQRRMREFIEQYRERFGDDPMWLAYVKGQNLRAHWQPLIDWKGPEEYLQSWRELVNRTDKQYLDDLGWADDRADVDWDRLPTFTEDSTTYGLDQLDQDRLDRENWRVNYEIPDEVLRHFQESVMADG